MSISGGYILLARQMDSSDIIHEPPIVRELWLYLLRKVAHRNQTKYDVNCSRGEGFFRLDEVQEDLCWFVGYRKMKYSKPQLTKSLRRLRERNMIETTKATRGVFVKVLNYDFFQDPANYERNGEGNAKETRRQQSGFTKNKNDERMKECKKYELPSYEGSLSSDGSDDDIVSKNGTNPPCPHQLIIDAYHEECPELSRVEVWNQTSRKQLQSRWRESKSRQSVSWWRSFFRSHIKASDFLMGKKTDFQANLGWIAKPTNFQKILNGQYANRGPSTGSRATDQNIRTAQEWATGVQ